MGIGVAPAVTARSIKSGLEKLAKSPPKTWSVSGVNTRKSLHGIIRYPAMMMPAMQGDVIDVVRSHVNGPCKVIDPFVGSGTIMTEALSRGLDFIGLDINPLAVLICEAKAAIDRGVDLENPIAAVRRAISIDAGTAIDVSFLHLGKWFSDEVAIQLSKIRRSIMAIEDPSARKVLWVVFADTIRSCSNSRTSTYKLHIRPSDKVPDASHVVGIFYFRIDECVKRIEEYRASCSERLGRLPSVHLLCADLRSATLPTSNAHQIVMTSPPYGDNATTIPYGQFSYLALNWIPPNDLPREMLKAATRTPSSLDSASLGGSKRDANIRYEQVKGKSKTLDRLLSEGQLQGKAQALRKVESFAADFYEALSHLHRQLHSESHWIFTTGNRTAAGIQIPLDAICAEFMTSLGGRVVAKIPRAIPVKRMAAKNSISATITTELTQIAEFR
jgi:hypothetical protein